MEDAGGGAAVAAAAAAPAAGDTQEDVGSQQVLVDTAAAGQEESVNDVPTSEPPVIGIAQPTASDPAEPEGTVGAAVAWPMPHGEMMDPHNHPHHAMMQHMMQHSGHHLPMGLPQHQQQQQQQQQRMVRGSASDPYENSGKLFIGGLGWDANQNHLRTYFGKFGEVVDCVVMRDPATGRSRGFGFLTFSDPRSCQDVLYSGPHHIGDRQVDPKIAVPRQPDARFQAPHQRPVHKTKKVFVGGLPPETTEAELKRFFSQFGQVAEVILMYDRETRRPRGFGFVTFENEEVVDQICNAHYHEILGKMVEVKRAEPKPVLDAQRSMRGRYNGHMGRGRGRGGYPRMDPAYRRYGMPPPGVGYHPHPHHPHPHHPHPHHPHHPGAQFRPPPGGPPHPRMVKQPMYERMVDPYMYADPYSRVEYAEYEMMDDGFYHPHHPHMRPPHQPMPNNYFNHEQQQHEFSQAAAAGAARFDSPHVDDPIRNSLLESRYAVPDTSHFPDNNMYGFNNSNFAQVQQEGEAIDEADGIHAHMQQLNIEGDDVPEHAKEDGQIAQTQQPQAEQQSQQGQQQSTQAPVQASAPSSSQAASDTQGQPTQGSDQPDNTQYSNFGATADIWLKPEQSG